MQRREQREVISQGVVDAYTSLKRLLRRTFSQDSPLIEAVEKLEQDPDSEGRKITLQEKVKAAGADQQPDITQAAQALLDQIKAQPGGEQHIQNSKNVVARSLVNTGGGDFHVGDKTTILNNYYHSAQYQKLEAQRKELQAQFEQTQKKTEQYPDDKDFGSQLRDIAKKLREKGKKLEEFKAEVIRLAETFAKIPLNIERLQLARQHFEAGNYPVARAILDAEPMGQELEALLQRKTRLEEQRAENEQHLRDKAHEFLILARLTAIDFNQPNRFDKTTDYFEQSLKAAHTLENTFAYAYFFV